MMTIDEAIRHCEEVAEEKEREAENLEYSKLDWKCEANQCLECAEKYRQLAEWLKELKAYKDNDMSLIYTNPLEEAIRCAMCTNTMRSDRGCDGGCKVDEQMYKEVLKAVYGLIEEVNADGND